MEALCRRVGAPGPSPLESLLDHFDGSKDDTIGTRMQRWKRLNTALCLVKPPSPVTVRRRCASMRPPKRLVPILSFPRTHLPSVLDLSQRRAQQVSLLAPDALSVAAPWTGLSMLGV